MYLNGSVDFFFTKLLMLLFWGRLRHILYRWIRSDEYNRPRAPPASPRIPRSGRERAERVCIESAVCNKQHSLNGTLPHTMLEWTQHKTRGFKHVCCHCRYITELCVCVYYVSVYSVPPHSCYEIASLDKPFVTVFGVFYYTILVIKSPLHHNLCQAIVTKSVALSLLPCHDTSRVVTECV